MCQRQRMREPNTTPLRLGLHLWWKSERDKVEEVSMVRLEQLLNVLLRNYSEGGISGAMAEF